MSDTLFSSELLDSMRSIVSNMLPDTCTISYQGEGGSDARGGAGPVTWVSRGTFRCRLENMSSIFEQSIRADRPEEKTRERLLIEYTAAGVIQKSDVIDYVRWDGIVKRHYQIVDIQEYTDNMEIPVYVEEEL